MLSSLNGLIKGYTPTFWLPFSIMKGIYQGDRKIPSIDIYHRVEFPMEDGEVLAIDFYPKEMGDVAENAPMIMFVPGVFGMSNDVYSAKFCRLVHSTLGWRTCVFNRRGYGGMPIKGSRVVGFTSYDDMHEIVKQLSQMFPKANIYLAGVSMGAANIQNYLAHYSEENLVKAACTVSCPWNAHIVTETVKRNPLLRKGIHNYQLKLFKEQLNNESFKKLLEERQICPKTVLKTTDNCHFDEVCATAGLGLQNREEYYEAMSTHNKIGRINVPVLSMNSSDDLLIRPSVVPFGDIERNPYFLHLQVTGGGHTEYFHGCKADYWAYLCALEYFRTIESMLADGNDVLAISKLAVNEININTTDEDTEASKSSKTPKMSNMRPEHFRFVEPLSDA
jgi:predicted alpha/beta-fold hydrolase